MKAATTIGLATFVVFSLLLISIFAVPGLTDVSTPDDERPLLGAHTSHADLQPEWSAAGQNMAYTVTILNDGPDAIKEVRIYQNPNYNNFKCENKTDWTMIPVHDYPDPELGVVDLCWYFTDNDHAIPANSSEDFEFSATTPQSGCNWTWKFETRDIESSQQNGAWRSIYDTTSVDDLEPKIIKTLGKPKKEVNGETWITNKTSINIEVYDQGECGISGLDYCEYRYDVDDIEVLPWTKIDWNSTDEISGVMHYYYTFYYPEESNHHLEIRCYDIAGNEAYHEQWEKVDSTPPTTKKIYGEPFYSDNTHDWITTYTPITLKATDGGDICAIDNVTIYYRWCQKPCYDNDNGPLMNCEQTPCNCNKSWESINENEINFTIDEESEHCIEFYSVDALGNKEDYKWQCVYVDDKKPVVKSFVGKPNIPCNEGENCDYWIRDHVTPINIKCYDPSEDPHPAPLDKIQYRYKIDNGDWTDWFEADANIGATIIFNEDSNHTLEYKCNNTLGIESNIMEKKFKVDSQPPVITKTMIGDKHLGDCPPQSQSDVCYVKGDEYNSVQIDVKDDDTYGCAVNQVTCNYEVWWNTSEQNCCGEYNNGWCKTESGSFEEEKNISFNEDSKHKLIINCEDALGNAISDEEYFLVDKNPPETTKTYGTPSVTKDGYRWILPTTDITLTATDEKVGVDHIEYRVTKIGNGTCPELCQEYGSYGSGEWTEVNGNAATFNIPEESCHLIEFYAVDKFGNTEETHSQCVMVDNTAPEITKIIGKPKVVKEDKTYVTQQTPINLSCEDSLPHPVGGEKIYYRYRISDDCQNWGDWTNWTNPQGNEYNFTFPEDSCHELEYYCEDALGNRAGATQHEIDIVDTKAPTTTEEIIGPKYEKEDKIYLDGITKIKLNCTDPQPHPVGNVKIYYRYRVNEGDGFSNWTNWTNWTEYTDMFGFPQESHHELEYYCEDALGNKENMHTEEYYVDHTPPVTSKTYGEPYFNNGTSEWITSNTPITLTATDENSIHASGVKETKYRITLLDSNEACYNDDVCQEQTGKGDFQTYTEPFKISEESCHLIEYYSVDNVNKTENTKKQCVFVDNTPPVPVKEVGKPASKILSTEDYTFTYFTEVNGHCWAEDDPLSVDCWDITKMTPITLGCDDQGPHPVNHNKVCFHIEWDGEPHDLTETYCDNYEGEMKDGFCCVGTEIKPFYFSETTEHNLAYYCVDALGNSNKENLDDEKFKVRDTAFNITLNTKWNLVSVPVKLADNSMDEVFKDIADKVVSVWQFDGYNWHVYTPNGDPTDDDITTMEPGWGYWIKTTAPATLLIGGDLIDGGGANFPQIPIVYGWNLIGYIGPDGKTSYNGPQSYGYPVGSTCDAYTKLATLRSSLWDTVTPSLATWWEPFNTDGDPNTESLVPLKNETYKMDPGAGYWLFYSGDEPAIYSWVPC